ncbi:CoA-transferase [Thauera sp.]|uniref:CoA-transferase n=1 Tax=Thauera sp. TaxID=1905334 RepID=UPI00262A8B37|nr:CoA-transferase [Thauera sp.]
MKTSPIADFALVNLGIPTLVASFVQACMRAFLQSGNGLIGSARCPEGMFLRLQTGAAGNAVAALPAASTFDSAVSFGPIRGGHHEMTGFGGLHVDQAGHLANWMVPASTTASGSAMA